MGKYFLITFLYLLAVFFSISSWASDDIDCLKQSESITSKSISFFEQVLQRITCGDCQKVKTSCDLKKLKKIPEVIFLGENHGNELSIAIRLQIFKLAVTGKFPLASEVGGSNGTGLLPWDSRYTNIKGLESPIPYAIALSYIAQSYLLYGDPPEDIIRRYMARYIERTPLFRAAYEDVRKQKQERCPACFLALDQAILSYSKNGEPEASVKLILSSTSTSAQAEILTEIHKRVIQIVKERYSNLIPTKNLSPILSISDAKKLGVNKGEIRDYSDLDENIQVNIREIDFTAGVADSLCQFSKSSSHLVVMVGDFHVEGMSKLLKKLSGGRIKIHHLKTFDLKSMGQFSPLLGSIRFDQ